MITYPIYKYLVSNRIQNNKQMKQIISKVLFLFLIWSTTAVSAQIVAHGTVQEGLTLQSKILHKTVRYTIYLPYDYYTSHRYYPVVYLLHGYTDNDIGWMQYGEANRIADEGIARGDFPAMILVTPDAGVSWYINNYDGSVRYEDFFLKEFIPYIESHYRIRAQRQFRAVAGLSMGGFGSLVYVMKHPDTFVAGAALSAAVYTDRQYLDLSQTQWERTEAVLYGPGLKGKARLNKTLLQNDPLHLVQTLPVDQLKKGKYYLDCGNKDYFTLGNSELHILMIQRHIPHEYIARPGRHSWEYWRSGLPGALEFLGKVFTH